MIKQIFFLGFLGFLLLACAPKTYVPQRPGLDPRLPKTPPKPKANPGECYRLSEVPRKFESTTRKYFEYTGSTLPDSGVVLTVVETRPKLENWVKKPSENCKSLDPEDCLVWCLEVEEAETVSFNEVRDTATISEYSEKEVVVNSLLNDTYKEWSQVVCNKDLNRKMILSIADSLRVRGFHVPLDCNKAPKCLQQPLKKYQTKYELPIGSFNFETLDALGVSY